MTRTSKLERKALERFDRATANRLGEEIAAAVQPLAEKYGIAIHRRGGSFGETSFTAKVECTIKTESGIGGRDADAFKQLARLFGMEPDDLGKEFALGRRRFVVAGCMSRAERSPILARDLGDGKLYRYEAEMILLALGRKPFDRVHPVEVPVGETLLAPKKEGGK